MKPVWGLTGGIGSGKSTILAYFLEKSDVCGISTDDLAKEIMAQDEVMDRLADIFGPEVFSVYGDYPLDRKWIASAIFANPVKKAELEAVVHPLVWAEVEKIIAENQENISFFLVESAIIFETNTQDRFDGIICAFCEDRRVQIERAVRRGMSDTEALLRVETQLNPIDIAMNSKFVIVTDTELAITKAQVDEVYRKIKEGQNG